MPSAAMNEPSRLLRREPTANTRLEVTAYRDARTFSRAKRHSGLVRLLRIVLPAVIVVAGGAFVGKAFFTGGDSALPVGFGSISVRPDGLVMEKPHVSGFQNNGEAYEVRADRAIQNAADPRLVTLEGIAGLIGLGGDDNASVAAGNGQLNTVQSTLSLTNGITVTTKSGMEARLEHADVDLDNGRMSSSRPVEIRSTDATIHGNEVEITEGGRRIIMRRGVSMTLSANRSPAAMAAAAEAAGAPGAVAAEESALGFQDQAGE
jgi:lipopolysaccharide export system protein LptC